MIGQVSLDQSMLAGKDGFLTTTTAVVVVVVDIAAVMVPSAHLIFLQ